MLLLEYVTPDKGILQIGIKTDWRGPHGRMFLFFGNKNAAPLTSVKAVVAAPSNLRVQLTTVPEIIPPRAQVLFRSLAISFSSIPAVL